MIALASASRAAALTRSLPGALVSFTWRPLPYSLILFVVAAVAAGIFGWMMWLRYLTELWIAYCAAYGLMLSARWLGYSDASYALIAALLVASALVAAMCAYAVSFIDMGIEYRPLPERLIAALLAAVITLVSLAWEVAGNVKLRQKEQIASDSQRRLQLEREVLQSQLKVLQAQIEPHFLYNTLATVRALVSDRPTDARRMLWDLIQYLRQALPSMREGMSNVAREIELARAYLSILEVRMADRLQIDVEFDPEIGAVAFPPTIVGTLVENAIKHGVEPSKVPCEVCVTAKRKGGALMIEVRDTGVGFEPETAGQGVGLDNARARLHLLYGDGAEIELLPNLPRGVIARITVND